jgi:hypothetical protein
MARKTRLEKIAEAEKQKQELDAYIKKLEAEQREVDRKHRTNRLCKRAGHIESVLPDTIRLDKAQFQEFIKRTLVTEYAKRELAKLLAPQAETPADKSENTPQTALSPAVANSDKPLSTAEKQA